MQMRPDETPQHYIERITKRFPSDNLRYLALVVHKCHYGQFRSDGTTPYSVHPFSVAELVQEWGGSEPLIAAALSHDILEDCDYNSIRMWKGNLRKIYGNTFTKSDGVITRMVEAVTIHPPASKWSQRDRYTIVAYNLLLAYNLLRSDESQSALIKLADLYDNNRTPKPGRTPQKVLENYDNVIMLLDRIHPIVVENHWEAIEAKIRVALQLSTAASAHMQ